ncbi:hypothetical protein DFO74_1503 [Chromohalobacter israelensis]|nr:hypothetical protein DFO74_1503 [Chromohalobacter salexigens]
MRASSLSARSIQQKPYRVTPAYMGNVMALHCSLGHTNGRIRTVAIPDDLYHALKQHGPRIGRIFRKDAYQAFTNALERAGIELSKGQ